MSAGAARDGRPALTTTRRHCHGAPSLPTARVRPCTRNVLAGAFREVSLQLKSAYKVPAGLFNAGVAMAMTAYSDSPASPEFRKLQEAQGDARTVGAISTVSKWAMVFNQDINKRKDAVSTLLGKASHANAPIKAEIRGRFQRVHKPGSILAFLPRVIEALVGALETTEDTCPRPREEGHETPLMASGRQVTAANRGERECSSSARCTNSVCRDLVLQLNERRREAEEALELERIRRQAVENEVEMLKDALLRMSEGKKALEERLALAVHQHVQTEDRATGIPCGSGDHGLRIGRSAPQATDETDETDEQATKGPDSPPVDEVTHGSSGSRADRECLKNEDSNSEDRSVVVQNPSSLLCSYCSSPVAVGRAVGRLNDAVSVVVPCGHGDRRVHPSCLLRRAATLAEGHRDPYPCRDCAACEPYPRLPTPAAFAGVRALRAQPTATKQGGRSMSLVANAIAFARMLGTRAVPSPRSYAPGGSYTSLADLVRQQGGCETSSYILCPLFGDALGMPQNAFAAFPRTSTWNAAVEAYRPLLKVVGATPAKVVLRLPRKRLYIPPHAQEYLLDLHGPWSETLGQWTFDVWRSLLEHRDPPPFPDGPLTF